MLLFGDFDRLPLNLRLSSWGLVRRYSDGLPEERESWFAWVHKEVMPAMLGEEQKELRMLAVFPGWLFCLRRSVMAQTEFPDSAGPIFEFLTVTPQELAFKDRKLVPPVGATEPPAKPGGTPEGTWAWVEPEAKTPPSSPPPSPPSKASKTSVPALATDIAPAEKLP